MKPKTVLLGVGDTPLRGSLYYGQDVRKSLRELPDQAVHVVCTSPPYWNLRDYGTASWEGGDPNCEHSVGGQVAQTKAPGAITAGVRPGADMSRCRLCGAIRIDDQIGLTPTPEEYIQSLVDVFRDVRRVLRHDGTLWLNLGDSYAGSGKGAWATSEQLQEHSAVIKERYVPIRNEIHSAGKTPQGFKPKDLIGIPWRVAFALQADGWYLRAAIPWVKRNCMPSSVQDRPTTGVEYVFLFAHPDSGGKYYYDIDSVRVPPKTKPQRRLSLRKEHAKGGVAAPGSSNRPPNYDLSDTPTIACTPEGGRNRRDVDWFFESLEQILHDEGLLHDEDGDPIAFVVNPRPYVGSHFAVWPPNLVRPMILAGTSSHGVCSNCGSPWVRQTAFAQGTPDLSQRTTAHYNTKEKYGAGNGGNGGFNALAARMREGTHYRQTIGWVSTCTCEGAHHVPATVLDPFSGSATTGMVALQEGRSYIGCDLNPDYLPLAEARLHDMPPPSTSKPPVTQEAVDPFDLFL